VLERAGVKRTTRDVMPIGLDGREDDPERPARPIPLAKALAEDTLLVYGMNGEPLPPDHGFPIRAFLPGWVATASIKWVGHVVVSEEPLPAQFALDHSLLIGPDYPPERGLPGQLATDQSIKSAFELAWPATLPAGPQTIAGRSWSGLGRIVRVEISLDGGQTVQLARLLEPNVPRAWVRWEVDWDGQPGEHRFRARATDEVGRTQPDAAAYNEYALLYDAVVSHPVMVPRSSRK
jgi:sulfane dehydrogenase subunit SoxC